MLPSSSSIDNALTVALRAGGEITAMGVMADLIKVLQRIS